MMIQDNETASQTQKPVEPDFNQLQSAINQEQKSIQQLYQRVQDIELYCKTERETHQTTLNQSQLHLTQVQNSLRKQCRENKKVNEDLKGIKLFHDNVTCSCKKRFYQVNINTNNLRLHIKIY